MIAFSRMKEGERWIKASAPGYFGTIKVEQVQSRIYGHVAILGYNANEAETIGDRNLTARYHITDTWLLRDDSWQIVASQAHRYYEDPAVGRSDPKSSTMSWARMS